jgi:hypothetical protein
MLLNVSELIKLILAHASSCSLAHASSCLKLYGIPSMHTGNSRAPYQCAAQNVFYCVCLMIAHCAGLLELGIGT